MTLSYGESKSVSRSVVSNSCATPWTVAHQAPLSTGFLQARILGLPFPSPGNLPNLGIELGPPALKADSLPSEPPEKPWCHMVRFTYSFAFQ